MRTRVEMARHLLESAYRTMSDNLAGVTLAEALYVAPGGYRSVLGTLKHAAGWNHVYRSYAFDPEPRHWDEIAWPRGLRDRIVTTQDYFEEIVAWFDLAHRLWTESLGTLHDEDLDRPRPLHWGATAPLFDILVMVAGHHLYHAGELNQLLAIRRGEAWEEGEEVEENYVSTLGHRVRPPWLDERQ